MSRVQAGGLVLLVVLAAALAGSTTLTGGAAAADPPGPAQSVEADRVEWRITVYENASARWTLTYERVLRNETERRRFEAFARTFNENETEAYRSFRRQARALAAAGRNATGRDMRAIAFSKHASLGGSCLMTQDCGTVSMSFTWTAFARQGDRRLVVGDVFGDGIHIFADQQLVFEAGPGLAFAAADPDTYTPSGTTLNESSSITYEGEQEFPDGRPRVVFVPAEDAVASPTTAATPSEPPSPGGTPPSPSPTDRDDGGAPMMLLAGLFVVLVGAAAALVWRRGGAAGFGSSGGSGGSAGAGAVAGEPAVPDEELLSDEDRVLTLLQENGGRMKQVDIVDETGWSKSKVSMLLSEMEDADQISKLRVGRENIVSLAGHEPEAAGSALDEE